MFAAKKNVISPSQAEFDGNVSHLLQCHHKPSNETGEKAVRGRCLSKFDGGEAKKMHGQGDEKRTPEAIKNECPRRSNAGGNQKLRPESIKNKNARGDQQQTPEMIITDPEAIKTNARGDQQRMSEAIQNKCPRQSKTNA